MTSLPSTTKEPTFESLVEEFREAVRSAVLYRHAESYERKCRSALLDYVRKLEADSERLDWLEETRPRVGLGENGEARLLARDREGALLASRPTLREAIDAARRLSNPDTPK